MRIERRAAVRDARRARGWLARWTLALGLVGCSPQAVLEVQLELPPAPSSGRWFAETHVRRVMPSPFEGAWSGDSVSSVPLASVPRWDCISVVGGDASPDLYVRVRFCETEDCTASSDLEAPEHLYELEQPLYLGRRTFLTRTIDRVPTCEMDSDCEAGRCLDGICGCAVDADCGEGFSCGPGRCVEEVSRCRVAGCLAGTSDFCDRDGVHVCETHDLDLVDLDRCAE